MRIHLVTFGVAGIVLASMAPAAIAQPVAAPNTVTISLAEYNRLVNRAANPAVPVSVPPTGAFVSQANLALRVDGELLRGTRNSILQGEVLRAGPTAVPLLSGGTLIHARLMQEPRPMPRGSPAPGSAQGAAAGPGGGRANPAAARRVPRGAAGRRLSRCRSSGPVSSRRSRGGPRRSCRNSVPARSARRSTHRARAPISPSTARWSRGGRGRRAGCSSMRRWRRAAGRASAGRRAMPGRPRRSARCGSSTTSRRSSPSARTICA